MRRFRLFVVGIFVALAVTICSGASSVADLDCSDFASEQEAQKVYLEDTSDPHNLDGDGDGRACEGGPASLPSAAQGVTYLVVGIVAMVALAVVLLGFGRRRKSRESPTLEQRISELSASLVSASGVVAEIEEEVRARQELVERLKGDAERAETLASLHSEEVDAVAQTLRAELAWLDRRSLKSNLLIGSASFVLGIVASVLVNMFVP